MLRYLLTGDGLTAATASIVVKTLVLYTIMVTGSIWEREVFGRYLFAPAFFWEDVFSMLVLALHTPIWWRCSPGRWSRAARCCWRWRPMPPTSSTRPSSCSSCAPRGWTRRGDPAAMVGGGPVE